MNVEDQDPTVICKILEEFRTNATSYYKSSMLPEKNTASVSNSRKLKYEEFQNDDECENFSKKSKLMTPNNTEIISEITSPWEIRRLKSEIVKYKAQIIQAEERITKLEGLKLETELHYAKEKKVLEETLNNERMKVLELENRLQFIRKREANTVERYAQLKSSEKNKENNNQQILLEIQKENYNLKEQIYENELDNIKKNDKDKISSLNFELDSLTKKDELNIRLIESLRNELTEKNKELRKLEIEQTKLLSATKHLQDLESERQIFLETRAYIDAQSKKLMQFSDLEKELTEMKEENRRLKSSISNTMYLEEVVEDLQNRQKAVTNLEQDVINLRSENQNQRVELESWNSLSTHYCISDMGNIKPFTLIQKRLEELVRKELWYESENNSLQLKISHFKEKLMEKENEIIRIKEQIECLKGSCETHVTNIRRLKKQLTLVSWERNDLRNLLDSCQKDVTINSEVNNLYEVLQKVIDGYKERMIHIENDFSLTFSANSNCCTTATSEKDFSKKEVAFKEEIKLLLEKIKYLNDQLEYRNLKGDFDPRQTKIIHLKSNPASEAIEQYEDRLTKANEEIYKLRERFKVIEEGNNEDITRIVEERLQTNSIKEINDLKDRVKSLEIQNQRLCEVFKKRSHDFRDAIYMLLGYKIDALSNNQYRLCSQYAFDPQDILLFQISQDGHGTMELLETSFSQTLTEFIDLHLKQHKSIPLFLASLTVDLFNKQTVISFSATEPNIDDN
ncbi:hypothetical protein PGB90_005364 [Kerria lacca]